MVSSCRRHPEAGLTLVELMVVIAIAGILLAIGFPMARSSNSATVSDLAQKVLITLRQARNTAVSTGAMVRVQISESRLTVDRHDDLGPGPPQVSWTWINLSEYSARGTSRIYAVTSSPDLAATTPTAGGLPAIIYFNVDGTTTLDGTNMSGATVYVNDQSNTYKNKVVLFQITGLSQLITRW